MSSYLSRLNPSERRFVVFVGLLFFFVVNLLLVWPRFSDWSELQRRLNVARSKLNTYETAIGNANRLKADLNVLQNAGSPVPPEDQSVDFQRNIQTFAAQNGFGITTYGRQTTKTNEQFIEQLQTVSGVSSEKQLVDFLYSLGAGSSPIRVRSLAARPDPPRQRLSANITLVASYQKNPKPAAAPARTAPAPPGAKRAAPAVQPAAAPAAPKSASTNTSPPPPRPSGPKLVPKPVPTNAAPPASPKKR